MKRKRVFILLAWFTLVGFSAIGLALIYYFQEQSIYALFFEPLQWYWQMLIGFLAGYVSAIIAWNIVNSKFLSESSEYYSNLIQQFDLNKSKIFFISICAGVGEEILFRGAIQYWLGVVITAIIFVAIHGYLNPWNWRISVYGLVMTLFMIGIGYMCIYFGLISSIATHFMIDLVLLNKLNNSRIRAESV